MDEGIRDEIEGIEGRRERESERKKLVVSSGNPSTASHLFPVSKKLIILMPRMSVPDAVVSVSEIR